jgi:hypothetical protein
MGFLELTFWQRHQRALGLIAIIIGQLWLILTKAPTNGS